MRLINDVRPARPPRRRPEMRKVRPARAVGAIKRSYAGPSIKKWPRRTRSSSIPAASSQVTTGLKIERPHARLKRTLTTGLFITVAVLGATVLARQPLGLVIVIGYGLFAFIRHIPGRTTFTASLVMVILVLFSLYLFGGRNVVTSALATYAFLLLAIGTITEWRDSIGASPEG